MHIRFFGNSTNASQKQKKQKKQRLKKEKRKTTLENGLSPFWTKYQIVMASLPNVLSTVIVLVVFALMAFGILPPSSIFFLLGTTAYLGK